MSTSPSLRDLYSPPSHSWTFVPPNVTSSKPSPSYQWSSSSPILDLSLDTGTPPTHVVLFFRSIVVSALMHYSSTALAMPLEVGKLLLQVQWVPRDALSTPSDTEEQGDNGEDLSDTTNDEDSYFIDPGVGPAPKYPAPKLVDDDGYVVRTSVMEEGTRPEYIIPVGTAKSTWAMVKRLVSFRGEGWLLPLEGPGLFTTCIHDVLLLNIQPSVDHVLSSLFLSPTHGFYRPPLWLPVVSHVITGFVLSPLDLIRTRLIAQSSMPRYKNYTGPLDALTQILFREGGLKGIYFHPHLFLPTILDTGLRAFTHVVLPSLIAPHLGFGPHVAADTHPVAWAFAELLGGCLGLFVTLPIETVRRRLQVQTRGAGKPLRTCVETRPVPYNGVVDALWHILTEERSDLPIRRPRKQQKGSTEGSEGDDAEEESDSWLRHTGIGQLYRGLGMRLAANTIVFLLTSFGGAEEVDGGGWAEL
ncbi:mitochondrial carrier domain-containing protein [Pisolithus marmoratus]|nr:mitochondrial carrier domain-containing protein [Pisolithus marmoratus]